VTAPGVRYAQQGFAHALSGSVLHHTPGTQPNGRLPGRVPQAYAVYVDERDIVWVSDCGADAILSFDPRTERFTSYPMSEKGADVRQILGRPGEIWLPESATNRLMVIRTGAS
jgi:virginiamycin B lyase